MGNAELDTNYLLGDILGRGGMGVVYSATQRSLDRRVAIKVPHPELAADPFVMRRFRTEALAGAKLAHPNIARVIDFGGADAVPYIVMEHVEGTPLDQIVTEAGPMELRTAADVSRQILAALGAAHTAGVIHADIKTANVLVETLPDGGLHARVIDFGLAHFSDEVSTFDLKVLSGTPDYLAPELIQGGSPTVASDIYAVGVVLYELLTGAPPFNGGTTDEIMSRQVDDSVVPPTLRCPQHGIPDAIEDAIMRALAKDPSARFATAVEFADALQVAVTAPTPRPWIAKGTITALVSPQVATGNWQRDRDIVEAITLEDARIARGRLAVMAAVTNGNPDGIVTAYLELVRGMIAGRQLAAAASELELGISVLRPNMDPLESSPAMWRLQLCLAALYSGLGEPLRAMGAAQLAQDDAMRAASPIGQGRATALLARLGRGRA